MSAVRRICLQQVDSTNTYIRKEEGDNLLVTAEYQTAGRGQGKNSWESEAGKNLLFSLKVHVGWLEVKKQFLLSMTGALALKATLDQYTDGITLKWPNDIYWKERKISGTLIETSIEGRKLGWVIYGVGLNINQQTFVSDAPNPISLYNIIGEETDRECVLDSFVKHFYVYLNKLQNGGEEEIKREYKAALFRHDGWWLYEDAQGEFFARISDVKDNGRLVLEDKEGTIREYEIKEVKFIL